MAQGCERHENRNPQKLKRRTTKTTPKVSNMFEGQKALSENCDPPAKVSDHIEEGYR